MLYINLLGDFRVVFGDEPATSLRSPRLQSFLAYLLLHREAPQSRRHIAFLFWPDSSENQAQTNLRKLIVSLRSALPEADRYIALDRHTLQWRSSSPYTLDVSDFEKAYSSISDSVVPASPALARPSSDGDALEKIRRLRAAVDLYTGDLLPGCYEEWIATPRERLRQAHLQTL